METAATINSLSNTAIVVVHLWTMCLLRVDTRTLPDKLDHQQQAKNSPIEHYQQRLLDDAARIMNGKAVFHPQLSRESAIRLLDGIRHLPENNSDSAILSKKWRRFVPVRVIRAVQNATQEEKEVDNERGAYAAMARLPIEMSDDRNMLGSSEKPSLDNNEPAKATFNIIHKGMYLLLGFIIATILACIAAFIIRVIRFAFLGKKRSVTKTQWLINQSMLSSQGEGDASAANNTFNSSN